MKTILLILCCFLHLVEAYEPVDIASIVQSLGKLAAFFSCEVAGGGDVDFCVERGANLSKRSPNMQWLMEGLAKPSSGAVMYERYLVNGTNVSKVMIDTSSSPLREAASIVSSMAKEIETMPDVSKNQPLQSFAATWNLKANLSGFLKDVPVDFSSCGFYPPSYYENLTESVKYTLLQETKASGEWCSALKRSTSSNLHLGFRYFSTASGIFTSYPASSWTFPLVYTASELYPVKLPNQKIFDARRDQWFISSSSLPKDIFLVVDNSPSLDSNSWSQMQTTVSNILRYLITPADTVGLILQDGRQPPCASETMVIATTEMITAIASWFEALTVSSGSSFLPNILQTACQQMSDARNSNLSSGPQYLIFISDGIMKKFEFTCKQQPTNGFLFITLSVGNQGNILEQISCLSNGMWWNVPASTLDMFVEFSSFIRDFTRYITATEALNTTDNATSVSFLPVRPRSFNTPRSLLTVGKSIFNQKVSPARFAGVAALDVDINDIVSSFLQARASIDLSFESFILYLKGRAGGLLCHSWGKIYPKIISNSSESRFVMADNIVELEGSDLVSSGIFRRMMREYQGFASLQRHRYVQFGEKIFDDFQTMSYFWTRFPSMDFVLVSVLPGDYIKDIEDGLVLVQTLASPPLCDQISDFSYPPPSCWTPNTLNFHRLDLLGLSLPDYDSKRVVATSSSTFFVSPRSYNAPHRYVQTPWKVSQVISFQQVVNVEAEDAAKVDKSVLGSGMTRSALRSLRASSQIVNFWKESLSWSIVPSSTTTSSSSSLQDNVQSIFLACDDGVMLIFPGQVFDDFADPTMQRWYLSTLRRAGQVCISPPRAVSASNPTSFFLNGQGIVITISTIVNHSKSAKTAFLSADVAGGRLFGVIGVNVTYDLFVDQFILSTSSSQARKLGCTDRPQVACYMIDDEGYVIVSPQAIDARLMGKNLSFLSSSLLPSHLTDAEPLISEQLLLEGVLVKVTDTQGDLFSSSFAINLSSLTVLEDQTPTGPRAVGRGVRFNVSSDSSSAIHRIALLELEKTNTFLLLIEGRQGEAAQSYCGPLSSSCPDVSQPIAARMNLGSCATFADLVIPDADKNLKLGTIVDVSLLDLAFFRRTYTRISGSTMTCFISLPLYGRWLLAIAAVLVCSSMVAARIFLRRRNRRRQAMEVLENLGKEDDLDAEKEARAEQEQHVKDASKMAKKVQAKRSDYSQLAYVQTQVTEDVWTRESGSYTNLEADVQEVEDEVRAAASILDHLQQRVQKQESLSMDFTRLQLRSSLSNSEVERWRVQVEELAASGHLRHLDGSIAQDLTELSEINNGILMPGTREAAFYRSNYRAVVHGLQDLLNSK